MLTPPPASPRAEFLLEKVSVQSRAVGEQAWARNELYGEVLAAALRTALEARGKRLGGGATDRIRARVYLADGAAPVRRPDGRREKPYVEVRLQLLDAATGAVRYSTHTQAEIAPPLLARFGWGPDADAIIRDALERATQDFASRL